MINHTVGRCLDLFEIDTDLAKRWAGMGKSGASMTGPAC
jgi:4-hydroxy-3-polyprenylbenzoate decarboxylase